MSAIKIFFNRIREVEQKRKEYEIKMIKQQEEEQLIPEIIDTCEKEFSECDFLLRRDWFIDETDIHDLLSELPDIAFYRIVDNAHNYSKRIRDILYNFQTNPCLEKLSLKLKDINDDDMELMNNKRQELLNNKFEESWKVFKTKRGLSRPESEFDNVYTDLYEKLKLANKKLEDEKKKTVSKSAYVPPHLRGKVQPPTVSLETEKIQFEIQKIENEIKKTKKQIEEKEHSWEDDRKKHHFNEIWNEMYEL